MLNTVLVKYSVEKLNGKKIPLYKKTVEKVVVQKWNRCTKGDSLSQMERYSLYTFDQSPMDSIKELGCHLGCKPRVSTNITPVLGGVCHCMGLTTMTTWLVVVPWQLWTCFELKHWKKIFLAQNSFRDIWTHFWGGCQGPLLLKTVYTARQGKKKIKP